MGRRPGKLLQEMERIKMPVRRFGESRGSRRRNRGVVSGDTIIIYSGRKAMVGENSQEIIGESCYHPNHSQLYNK